MLSHIQHLNNNLSDHFLGKPRIARDYILKAVSDNGIKFIPDETFRFKPYTFFHPYMSYYVMHGFNKEIHFVNHVQKGNHWKSELFPRVAGIKHFSESILSPVILGNLLLFGTRSNIVKAIDLSNEVETNFSIRLASGSTAGFLLKDFCMLDKSGVCIVSIDKDGYSSLHMGHFDFDVQELIIEEHLRIKFKRYQTSPCLLKRDREYYLYFRGMDKLHNDSCIYLTQSTDFKTWSHPQEVMHPHGLWAKHGVGFPFVHWDTSIQKWIMYYTGYWGDCKNGDLTYMYYERKTAEISSV